MASKSTFPCPACGEDVPAKARACPHCGACEKSGWNDDESASDGLDLPGEDFDYDKFVQDEFGSGPKPKGIALVWKITAVVLLVITVVLGLADFLFR